MIDLLSQCYPSARADDIATFAEHFNRTMDRYEINKPLRQAHFLAQVGHESGQLRYREEIASGAAYEFRSDLGNTRRGDGMLFKGRGLIQLTGRSNYTQYATAIGRRAEILRTPELIADDTSLCVDVAGWYWATRGLNTWADKDSLLTITKRINGGYNGLEDRKRLLYNAKRALNLGHIDETEVHRIQRLLNEAGAGLLVDGSFGRHTKLAVIAFQRTHDLKPDGIVGPKTMAKLGGYD